MKFDDNSLNDPKVIEAAGVLLRQLQMRPRHMRFMQRQESRSERLERRRERFVRAIRSNLNKLELTPEELLSRVKQGR